MKSGKITVLAAAFAVCLGVTGCSTFGENSSLYFSMVGENVSILTGSSSRSSSSSSSSSGESGGKTALDAPSDFVVNEDGTYSFSAVENADYYVVYLYDTSEGDDASYAYMGSNIEEDGSGSYSGSILEEASPAYGTYRAEAVAYPSVTSDEYKKSESSTAELVVSGEVAEPELAYLWDCFAETLTVQIANSADYSSTAQFETMTVTLVNAEDSSDVLSATVEDGADEIAVEGVSADTTYTIRAEALWDETIVTNASFDAELGSVTTSSAMNVTSDSYTYCNDDIYSYLDYPMVGESFDPEEGGIAGSWYKEETSGFGGVTPAAYIYYTAVPTDTADGSLYSYDVTIAKEEGTIDVSKDWYSGTDLDPLTGSLEIYEDGTFTMSIDLFYLGEHAESGMTAYVYATEIDGKWTDNGDGTITLAYDHSSVEITDTGDED